MNVLTGDRQSTDNFRNRHRLVEQQRLLSNDELQDCKAFSF